MLAKKFVYNDEVQNYNIDDNRKHERVSFKKREINKSRR